MHFTLTATKRLICLLIPISSLVGSIIYFSQHSFYKSTVILPIANKNTDARWISHLQTHGGVLRNIFQSPLGVKQLVEKNITIPPIKSPYKKYQYRKMVITDDDYSDFEQNATFSTIAILDNVESVKADVDESVPNEVAENFILQDIGNFGVSQEESANQDSNEREDYATSRESDKSVNSNFKSWRGEEVADFGRNSRRASGNFKNRRNGIEAGQKALNIFQGDENMAKTGLKSQEDVRRQNKINISDSNEKIKNRLSASTVNVENSASEPFIFKNVSGQMWVVSEGTFLERISAYNKALSAIRQEILRTRGFVSWRALLNQTRTVWENVDNFMDILQKNYSHRIRLVLLEWSGLGEQNKSSWSSLADQGNVLIRDYYEWVGSEPLCKWITTQGLTKARWDAVYNRRCNVDPNLSLRPKSIEPLYFHAKPINPRDYWPNKGSSYPSHFYTTPPHHVLYIHLAQDVVITPVGDILSADLKLVPYGCSQDVDPRPPAGYQLTAVYKEVFIITEFWGAAVFHKMLENVPRLAPYLEFLRSNPSVNIHVADRSDSQTRELLRMLGLSPERLVSGVIRAKVVYLPQATPCGFPQIQAAQLLSQLYREYIQSSFGEQERRSVLLIQRTGSRQFKYQKEIKAMVLVLTEKAGFRFEIFLDDPVPSLTDTMKMFNRALVVVAPHGAGLSNLLFCEPGTYVVEGVCNPPHVNMCYQHTAHILGLRYHGVPSNDGCEDVVDIRPEVIRDVLNIYLTRLSSK